jgi:lysozyme family protein
MADDPDPFGRLDRDPRDRLAPPKTAAQSASSAVGFVVMGVGGGLVALGVVVRVGGSPLGFALLAVGVGVSYLGYWLFNRGRVRRRYGRG